MQGESLRFTCLHMDRQSPSQYGRDWVFKASAQREPHAQERLHSHVKTCPGSTSVLAPSSLPLFVPWGTAVPGQTPSCHQPYQQTPVQILQPMLNNK